LKLKYDEPLSNFAINFNSRHYKEAEGMQRAVDAMVSHGLSYQAGAYTRPLLSST
jgi:hypothetical protein